MLARQNLPFAADLAARVADRFVAGLPTSEARKLAALPAAQFPSAKRFVLARLRGQDSVGQLASR